MRILIELPTWLGDAVMASPAFENILDYYKGSEVILIGSPVSISVLENHPRVKKTFIFKKKYLSLLMQSISLGRFDVFFSFRSSLRSKLFKSIIQSKVKYQFDHKNYKDIHQVKKYNNFVNDSLGRVLKAGKLKLYNSSENDTKDLKDFFEEIPQFNNLKLLGINPGASYGNSKCWYPTEYAKTAAKLSKFYDILIFGNSADESISKDIEMSLIEQGVTNFNNLAGKTSITELLGIISKLDLFITGDSGPMHISAAYQIPTIAIFGPTRDHETSQWMNEKSIIVKKNLDCQPCMKRRCPLGHHNCMKLITAEEIVTNVKSQMIDQLSGI